MDYSQAVARYAHLDFLIVIGALYMFGLLVYIGTLFPLGFLINAGNRLTTMDF
jgi:hypothetical protein